MRNQILGPAAAIAFSAMFSSAACAQANGYFTLDQATAGADIYANKCASCHGAQMEGYIGPSLRGHAFQVITSRQATADRLLLIISRNEPQDNPGSLTDEQDGDVLAYILQVNGYPAGKAKLSAFTARQLNLTAGR
ncbi:MAG TPA: cytochrome c [Rhizomicrobium sp.]|nr:cytochrome c [Rhizomicrobium sp.]